MIRDLSTITTYNKKAKLDDFLKKVIYLSQQCQINTLHNANIILPKLVEETFDTEFINEVYEKLN